MAAETDASATTAGVIPPAAATLLAPGRSARIQIPTAFPFGCGTSHKPKYERFRPTLYARLRT